MVKVIIIGSGNVAQHLIAAFQNSKNTGDEIELVLFSRKANTLVNLLDADLVTTDLAALLDADLYIIAVSDDALIRRCNVAFKTD
jgi:predicted dehydrogenase